MRLNFANSPCYTRFIFFQSFSRSNKGRSQVKWNMDWFLEKFSSLSIQLKFKLKEIVTFLVEKYY